MKPLHRQIMTYSDNPAGDFLRSREEAGADIGQALTYKDCVVIRSGKLFAILYPDSDAWHIQYAAGPIGELAAIICLAVPYQLPFVTFHRRFETGSPRRYKSDRLITLLQIVLRKETEHVSPDSSS